MAQSEELNTAEPDRSDRLRDTGERIETLLDAASAGGVVARERAEELVRLVVDLYGAGLERMLDVLHDAGRLDEVALDAIAEDELVASLLLVHGLHPHDVVTRVEAALAGVRPYLGSHGGDVELLDVTPDGVARLRLLGSCDGCPSSSVTLQLAVEGAVEAAAPEVTAIEVETAGSDHGGPALISVDSLRSRLDDGDVAAGGAVAGWAEVPELVELGDGELRGLVVGGTRVMACRLGADLYTYRDRCPRCSASLAAASLERMVASGPAVTVLTCPTCRGHYDVRRAGSGLDVDGGHLEPVPLLQDSGVVRVAVRPPETVAGPVTA